MTAERSSSWGIVGGGILGVTLALRLSQNGQRVTLFEAAKNLGGLASCWPLGDVLWDRHYHVTLKSDAHLRGLLGELGLEEELEWKQTRTACYAGGRLYSVSDAVEFLRFPYLGLVDKLRVAATLAYASTIRDGRRLEKVKVAEWLVRWSGRRAFERFWLPLLRSKLGESYRETSAAFIWATIARLNAARRAGRKQEVFGYVPGGYARVLDRLARALKEAGVEIRSGQRVENVDYEDGGIDLKLDDGSIQRFDRVVLTVPPPLAVSMCPTLTPNERAKLEAVRYLGIVCASVLLDRPLAGYYVTNILDDGMPFTGVIEMSALVDRSQFGGRSLIYLPRYLASDDPFFSLSDEEVEESFLSALTGMHPGFDRGQVAAFRVSRVRHVLALSTLDYSATLPTMKTSIPHLYLVNSAQIANGTLNVNETIELAESGLRTLLDDKA
ncbi:MAG: NAD(P)/FAD-dependent oxidoreductase [bacterium]|nr:NAD(P)/FAD-dependent oxidoreductase [bacterium]